MASRPEVTMKTLDGVREELTCAICHSLFTVPKTLPCLHTFCEDCLSQAETARRRMRADKEDLKGDAVECPSCRGVSHHSNGAAGIRTNFPFVNLIEHLLVHEKISTKATQGSLKCGKCKEDLPAIAFCYDCRSPVCEACKAMHEGSREHSSHSICSLDEIKGSKSVMPMKRVYMCPKHNAEQRLFCFDCQVVICRDCTVVQTDHRDHRFEFINLIIDKEKQAMSNHFEPLEGTLALVSSCRDRLQSHIDTMVQINDKRIRTINSSIDSTIKCLELRRAILTKESQSIHKAKKKVLKLELHQVEGVRASIASAIDFCKTTLETGSDVEVLMFKREMIARTKTLTDMQKDFESFEITEEDHTQYTCEPAWVEGFGKLCEAPVPEKCTAVGPGLEVPLQSVQTNFTVSACDAKGQALHSGGVDCSVEVSCVPTISQRPVKYPSSVLDNANGTYTVKYLPEFPGATKISIKFDNQHIQGSPFNARVARNYIHPVPAPYTLVVPNSSPWGLAMVSDTELAITASDCVVHVYDVLTSTRVGVVRSNFTRPYGISADHENYLWITDRETHMVQKFEREANGEFVKLFQFGSRGIGAGQFSHPRGIAVHPSSGRIYISDMKNNRIQIFKQDQDGPQYVGQFGAPGSGRGLFNLPAGMIFNFKDELIVCDDHNCRLQVFDPEGNFKYMIGSTSCDKGLLCSPIGITQDFRGRLIITEFGSHSVTFLSPDGDILNCIRTIGAGFGQFVHPRGITSDSAGYVYVADNENMRVVRF